MGRIKYCLEIDIPKHLSHSSRGLSLLLRALGTKIVLRSDGFTSSICGDRDKRCAYLDSGSTVSRAIARETTKSIRRFEDAVLTLYGF